MSSMLVTSIGIVVFAATYGERPDINGVVIDDDGAPIAGATVYVYSGAVKEGTSTFCPTCYPDCGKRVKTDENGAFHIKSLDPTLLFTLLAVAENHAPVFHKRLDPAGDDVQIVLPPIPPERLEPEHVFRGKVEDMNGRPIAGALVEPFGKKTERGQQYGGVREVDALAVTTDDGEFRLTSAEPGVTYFARVSARGFAPVNIHWVTMGAEPRSVQLGYGSTLSGRVMNSEDQPVDGVTVGVIPEDLNSHDTFGESTVGTNADGYFEIPNLPPNRDYFVYGKMESLQGIGALGTTRFRTGAHDSSVDVGTLTITPGHRVSGRVVLSDGAEIPPKTRLFLGSEDAWDALALELDGNGNFEARNVPADVYGVSVRIAGYRLSPKNVSKNPTVNGGLIGLIDRDIEDLLILMEPGEGSRGGSSTREQWDQERALRKRTLEGVENAD